MHQRKLGAHGPSVGAIGLGCMGMSAFYGPRDEAESLATLDMALEGGVTLFDTSDIYGPHTNEELLGRWMRGRRARVLLATKFVFSLGLRPRSSRTVASVLGVPPRTWHP